MRRFRYRFLLLAGLLAAPVAPGQVRAPEPRATPDTLTTVTVWNYAWPAARRDSFVHQLRMQGGGLLVHQLVYTMSLEEGVRARLAWVSAPLKRVHHLDVVFQPFDADGRPVAPWRGGGRAERSLELLLPPSSRPVPGEGTLAPIPYGPAVVCVQVTRVLVVYMDGTMRSFSGRNLQGLFGAHVEKACRAPARISAVPGPARERLP